MGRALIESGSHVHGVDPALFGLPPGTSMRFELPAGALAPCVSDYHVFDSDQAACTFSTETILPRVPAIRFIIAPHAMNLTIGDGTAQTIPPAALYGSTSHAAEMAVGRGGVTIGVTMTAVGMARLTAIPADSLRDRVVPLSAVLPAEPVRDLVDELRASDQGPSVKAILDRALPPLLAQPHPMEADIQRIANLLAAPGRHTVQDACDHLGMNQRRLERLAKRFFGFTPKLLLRRTRLLRSIVALKLAGPPFDLSLIDSNYHDHSHFTKDAKRFLGKAPMRFLRKPTPYLDAALRARAIVQGTAWAALQHQ
ncbi:helix-turn-helix domain-containing protein [Altererythrobacter aerius]|uniref:Helix-turn-helix domain-containing protein n=1 Tax=Tsuneonella aeria TaxID=1837929 RepID=A0A6I4T9A0_9SPHN|nr:helix-turn-helix domain-containing protein [Tsuneonella aeria]MXO73683.1 helix-turn-helix domain-containing protein [Tsuneonella aeria]